MKFHHFLLFLKFILPFVHARGITSKLGASCLYVAANFTSFPYDCVMPDLAFKCRCQNEAFLGTVTNCIETRADDPSELSEAYKQLVNTCLAQGGKTWNIIDLVKLNENATNYLIDYNSLPVPMIKASLVWKAQKIHDIRMKKFEVSQQSETVSKSFSFNNDKDPTADMIQNDKFIDVEKNPKHHNLEEIEKIGVSKILETPRTLLYNPVEVPDNLYNISYNSVSKLLDQRNLATTYSYYIYIYWGSVMLIAIIANITQWTSPYWNNKLGKTKVAIWLRRKIICPQIFKPNHVLLNIGSNSVANNTMKEMTDGPIGLFDGRNRVKIQTAQTQLLGSKLLSEDATTEMIEINKRFKNIKEKSSKGNQDSKFLRNCKNSILYSVHTMPVRLHAIVIIGYLILTIVLCSVNYEIVFPNTVFTCKKGQKFVSIADRTGIIGTIQLPIVYLFSTRNNIFSCVTGISYRTFQMFHKWTSRIVFILLILHCGFYLLYVNVRGDYIERWGLLKWRCANTAIIAVSLTVGISFFKRFFYEFFKYSHKILLIIFSIGSWYHCITLGWIEYLCVAYAIWGLEYVIRLGKIISSGGILKGQCKVIYDKKSLQPHSIRIVINHSGWWKPYPGCYCWLKFLKWNMCLESHPFTVVSATNAKNYNQLVFIIRVKNGLTKRLAKYVGKQPNGECTLNMLVEGPYGNNIPFKQYNQSVLVAGGVGLSVIYSIAMDLAQIYRAQKLRGKRSCEKLNRNKYISLIWIVPNFESLIAFENEIESLINFKDIIEVQIFITKKLQDELLQKLIDAEQLVNPFGVLGRSYESEGFSGFANTLLELTNSSNSTIDVNGLGNNKSIHGDTNISTKDKSEQINFVTETSSFSYNNANSNDFSEIDVDAIKKNDNNSKVNEQTIIGSPNQQNESDASNNSNDNSDYNTVSDKVTQYLDLERRIDVIEEQRNEEIRFLEWLINENREQISINFEDKPYLQDELHEFICQRSEGQDRPLAVIACGPATLNVEVRLSVVKCLEAGHSVDYYEEELLW